MYINLAFAFKLAVLTAGESFALACFAEQLLEQQRPSPRFTYFESTGNGIPQVTHTLISVVAMPKLLATSRFNNRYRV
jgi:hypothetical protein